MIPYAVIQPPFTLDFERMPKAQLKAYFSWFVEVSPERIGCLEAEVRKSPAQASWRADGTIDSLEPLDEWFEGQVETRKSSQEEVAETRARLVFPVDVPDEELTTRTFSLAMDVGMYFGKVILANNQGTHWDQVIRKRFADHGQAVVVGLGPVPLNPVRIVVNLAYAIARRQKGDSGLPELYRVWTSMKRPR